MEELNNLNKQIINEIENAEAKHIVIELKETITPEQRMAIEAIRKIQNPFKMITVQDIIQDLGICETIAYKTFRRNDFPSINIGKNNQVMLLPYLMWKMSKRV